MVKRKRVLWILFGLAAVYGLSAAGFSKWRADRLENDLQAAVQQAKAAGLMTTLAEFEASLLPHNQQAADAWNSAAEMLRSSGTHPTKRNAFFDFMQASKKLDDPDVASMEHLMEKAKPYLDALKHAASFGPFVRKKNWNDTWAVDFPEASSFTSAARSFSVAAVLSASKGDAEKAVEYLEFCRHTISIASAQPHMIGCVVAAACYSMTCTAIAIVGGFLHSDSNALDKLQAIADSLPLPVFKDVLGHELVMLRLGMKQIAEGQVRPSSLLGYINAAEELLLQRATKEAEVIILRHITEVAVAWGDLAKVSDLSADMEARDDPFFDPAGTLAARLLPRLDMALSLSKRTEAMAASARIGVAALRIRAKTGAWPTLDEAATLAGVDAEDPFSGDRLRYVATKRELRVYSVGLNRRDDGGRVGTAASGRGGDDDNARFIVTLPADG